MKHPKHVIYLITKLELGGAQKVCLMLLNGLKELDIQALLISGTKGPLVQHISSHENTLLLEELTRETTTLLQEWRCFLRLVKILQRLRTIYPDVILHTHSTKAGLMGRWAAFFAGISYRVHTIHGYAFHAHQPFYVRYSIIFLEWLTSFVTTHFVCVSSEDAKTGLTLFPHFSSKHTIIRAAVDWHQFYMPSRLCTDFPKDTPFIFGTVACFKKQKNLMDIVQAFAWAYKHNSNIRLEIIGDGTQRNKIIGWINEHNLSDMITLHGWQEQVAPFMTHWHAFILSSLWEGLPCAIIEARLLKLPVLCYNTGGIHDVIMHGKNGLLFEQHKWQELAKAMLDISNTQSLHEPLSSFKDDLHDFKPQVMINQHMQLYTSLLNHHKTIDAD